VTKKAALFAVLDANVLYSAAMRDFFMRLTSRYVFQPKWTEEIHQEWIEAVLRSRPDLDPAWLTRTRDLMNQHGNDWHVPAYEHLIPTLPLTDLDDRHVLAAAIASKAGVIVTQNLSDFPATILSPYSIRALHPDDFACELLEREPIRFLQAMAQHRASLKNPPKTVPEFLSSLEVCGLVRTAARLQSEAERL
jgi:predicted nucleic acid-binding protein